MGGSCLAAVVAVAAECCAQVYFPDLLLIAVSGDGIRVTGQHTHEGVALVRVRGPHLGP